MAAKTPVTVGTTGFVDPDRGLFIGPITSGQSWLTNGSYDDNRLKYIQKLYYFDNIDDGDTWASGITGIKAVFTMADALADNFSANAASTGIVTFETTSVSDTNGWVLLFIDPVTSGLSGCRQL